MIPYRFIWPNQKSARWLIVQRWFGQRLFSASMKYYYKRVPELLDRHVPETHRVLVHYEAVVKNIV
jgi:hypothetical protein